MKFANLAAAALLLFGSCKETKTPAESYLTVEPAETLLMESVESTGTLAVETNCSAWNFTVEEGKAWCTASKGADNTLRIKTDYNRSETERSAVVTITGNSNNREPITRTVTVVQAGTVNRGAALLARTPYYEKYPDELVSKATGDKTTVTSGVIPLYFYGWGINNDHRFTLDFPAAGGTTYRRAILSYRMGGMNAGPHEYDYTTMIFVKDKRNGEWFELVRAITPYGGSFNAGWEKHFYFDVTDYLPILDGTTEFRIYFDGDWGGPSSTGRRHTATLTFDLYEGEPERNSIWAAKVYDSHVNDNTGYRRWGYGFSGEDDIENDAHMGMRILTVPDGVKTIEMKVTITGYGHDQGKFPDRTGYQVRNAAEFDSNTYTVTVNGETAAYPGTIFIACGQNYAQAGTYYYDRANFCPGNPAVTHYWNLLNIPQNGGELTLNLDLERFISSFSGPKANDGVASYFVEVDLFGFDR